MSVLVVGGGVAGAAAAWRAGGRGFDTLWVRGGPGASALGSGAADLSPWARAPEVEPLSEGLCAFARSLGAWHWESHSSSVASAAGVVRAARARDPLVLDLEGHAGKVVGVATSPGGVDLAASVAASSWARDSRTKIVGVECTAPPHACRPPPLESTESSLEVARAQAQAVYDALTVEVRGVDAWLVPEPWLGSDTLLQELSRLLQRPVGCALGSVGCGLGTRLFRRLEAFAPPNVRCARGFVTRLEPATSSVNVELQNFAGESHEASFDAVVLCIGGLVGGGIRLDRRRRFSLSVGLPGAEFVWTRSDGGSQRLDVASQAGVDFCELGRAGLSTIGVTQRPGLLPGGVYAAGDCLSGASQTLLGAAQSAIDVVDALV